MISICKAGLSLNHSEPDSTGITWGIQENNLLVTLFPSVALLLLCHVHVVMQPRSSGCHRQVCQKNRYLAQHRRVCGPSRLVDFTLACQILLFAFLLLPVQIPVSSYQRTLLTYFSSLFSQNSSLSKMAPVHHACAFISSMLWGLFTHFDWLNIFMVLILSELR